MLQRQHSDPASILVVDDESSMRPALSEPLQRTGNPVVIARDGQAALELLEQGPIWLILADLRMPRLGGLGLLREVKRRFCSSTGRMVRCRS